MDGMAAEGSGTAPPEVDAHPSGISRPGTRWTRWVVGLPHRPAFWAGVLALAFFAISVYAESVTFLSLQHAIGNLPIFMQALSSTSHGNVPLYESQDCMGKARCSFLLVHPGFVLFFATPIYWAFPSAFTLFSLQSLVVALAAAPLYWLTSRVTGSSSKALLAVGMYLVWAPLIATLISALWIESVLPLEMFAVAALWEAGRFRSALSVAVLPFLTIEVGPVFCFLLGLFFLAPAIAAGVHLTRDGWSRWRNGASSLRECLRSWGAAVRAGFRARQIRYALILMASSVTAYVLVNIWMNVTGAGLLGVASPSVPSGLAGVFYDNSVPRSPSVFEVLTTPRLLFTSTQTLYTAEYWLVLYALLAFIPLLSRRALILSVPWIGFTFLTLGSRFTTIGVYAGGVAAVPLFIGLAYGLRRIPLGTPSTVSVAPPSVRDGQPGPLPPVRPARRRRRSRAIWAGAVGIAIVANVLLCPIDPLLPAAHISLGEPFSASYFVSPIPAGGNLVPLEQMIALIPSLATVAAPPLLAPLVINDIHAYLLTDRGTPQWNNQSRLPFNTSGGPEFALISGTGAYLPPSLLDSLGNASQYDVRGYVTYSPVGPVLLYEKGYDSTPEAFGRTTGLFPNTELPGQGLTPGPDGVSVTGTSGTVITSRSNLTSGGVILRSSAIFLPPGSYVVRTQVRLTSLTSGAKATGSVANMRMQGFAGFERVAAFPASSFLDGAWSNLTMTVDSSEPVLSIEVAVSLLNVDYALSVAMMIIEPASDA